jgi:hypothetical protein
MTPQDILTCARTYLGVRYRHQGRTAHGLDCVGLLIRVAHDLQLTDFDLTGYGRHPDPTQMTTLLAAHLHKQPGGTAPRPAEILLLADGPYPCHLALVGDKGEPFSLIHAWLPARKIVEHRASPDWLAKIRGLYRFPQLSEDL